MCFATNGDCEYTMCFASNGPEIVGQYKFVVLINIMVIEERRVLCKKKKKKI